METNAPSVVCAQCSYINPPQARGCNGCGVAFGGYAPMPPTQYSAPEGNSYAQAPQAWPSRPQDAQGRWEPTQLSEKPKQKLPMAIIILFSLGGIGCVFLIVISKLSQPVYINAGQQGVVAGPKSTTVTAFTDEQAFNDYNLAMSRNDEMGIMELGFKNRFFHIEAGSKVLILDIDQFRNEEGKMYEVRVLDGSHVGKVGYVSTTGIRPIAQAKK
jgi:hypothetical protein